MIKRWWWSYLWWGDACGGRGDVICEHGIHVFVDTAEIEPSIKYGFPGRRREKTGDIPDAP